MRGHKEGLSEYDLELLIEVVDGELINRGQRTHQDELRLDGVIKSLPTQTQELLVLTYRIGYQDAISRATYGTSSFEHRSKFASRIREKLEENFQKHQVEDGTE